MQQQDTPLHIPPSSPQVTMARKSQPQQSSNHHPAVEVHVMCVTSTHSGGQRATAEQLNFTSGILHQPPQFTEGIEQMPTPTKPPSSMQSSSGHNIKLRNVCTLTKHSANKRMRGGARHSKSMSAMCSAGNCSDRPAPHNKHTSKQQESLITRIVKSQSSAPPPNNSLHWTWPTTIA